MKRDNISSRILFNLNESIGELFLSDYSSDEEEYDKRLKLFDKALDDFCSKTGTRRVGKLEHTDSPSEIRIRNYWYGTELILPDKTSGFIYIDVINNIYYTYFDNSKLYHWFSGMNRFKNTLDSLVKDFKNTKHVEKLNKEESESERERYLATIAYYILEKHSRIVYKGVPRNSRDKRQAIDLFYSRDFLKLSKDVQMAIIKKYADEFIKKESDNILNKRMHFTKEDAKAISYDDIYNKFYEILTSNERDLNNQLNGKWCFNSYLHNDAFSEPRLSDNNYFL